MVSTTILLNAYSLVLQIAERRASIPNRTVAKHHNNFAPVPLLQSRRQANMSAPPKYAEASMHDHEQGQKLLRHREADEFECSCPACSLHACKRRNWVRRNASLLLSILFGLTTVILVGQLYRQDRYQHTGDINGIAPRFSQKVMAFAPDEKATAMVGHPEKANETKEYWKTFAPDDFGLLDLEEYTAKNFPDMLRPSMQGDYKLVDTSMAHQLHCLQSIMEHVSGAMSGGGHSGHPAHSHNDIHSHSKRMEDHSWHIGHCFDYIRQGIMCCGDTALEGQAISGAFPKGLQGSDGWGTKHVCKDYGEIKGWIEGRMAVH